MPTCAEAILQLLRRHGVDHVFSIPGVHTVELYRRFAASGLTHITPRHEQGAGFMAYGYAMATANGSTRAAGVKPRRPTEPTTQPTLDPVGPQVPPARAAASAC